MGSCLPARLRTVQPRQTVTWGRSTWTERLAVARLNCVGCVLDVPTALGTFISVRGQLEEIQRKP